MSDKNELNTPSIKKIAGTNEEDIKKAKKIILKGPKNVATAFEVNETEQAMLIEAGRIAVRRNISQIKRRNLTGRLLR